MYRVDVRGDEQLQKVIRGLAVVRRDLAKTIRSESRGAIRSEFTPALAQHTDTTLENRALVGTNKVEVSDRNVTLSVGSRLGGKFRGGFDPRESARAVEFGANPQKVKSYKSRRKGKTFEVHNRHTQRQFKPNKRKGYVFYPAIAEMAPRFLSLWTQTAVRYMHDAFEGKL